MADNRKVDIFWLLNQLDSSNFDLWDQLSEDQRKEVSPFVILRWLSGCNDPEQLVMLGDIAATYLFDFGQKKELMLKVLTACACNGGKRYKWVNPKGSAKSSSKALQLIALTYNMSMRQAAEVRPQFTKVEIIELAEAQAWQKEEVKDLQKELG